MSFKLKVLCVFFFIVSEAVAEEWPQIPMPEDSSLVIVSEDMVFNGIPMKSWQLTTTLSKDELIEFYSDAWKKSDRQLLSGAPGYQIQDEAPWIIISRIENGYLMTVQLNKKSEFGKALLGISKIEAEPVEIGKGFPVPSSTKVVNDILANDDNKKSRTIVAVSDSSVATTIKFYRNFYSGRKWNELTNSIDIENKGGALMFQRGSEEVNITVNRAQNGTNIVAIQAQN